MSKAVRSAILILASILPARGSAVAQQALAGGAVPPAQAQTGHVDFSTSGTPKAQALFLLGLAQLHNFEYDDAAALFRQAQEAEAGFAMATWGEAMTKNHPVWMEQDTQAGRDILNRLAPTQEGRLAKAPTQREKDYLGAVDILYNGAGTKEQRDFAYADSMAELHAKYPEDVDAATFHALALLGRDVSTYMKSAAILEEVFCAHPDHPGAAHYLIHSYDDPVHAPLGLRAARVYAKIAPAAAHAQHMTSHIFIALGMWDEEIAANETAVAVVNRNRAAKGLAPRECGHYNAWLEYGYLQAGRPGDARRLAEACMTEARSGAPPGHDPGMVMDPDRSSLGSATQMWARYLIDSGDAPQALLGWDLPQKGDPPVRLTSQFVLGLLAARQGKVPPAKSALAGVQEARAALQASLDQKGGEAASDRARAQILENELRAAILMAEKKGDEAVALLKQAVAQEESLPFAFGPPFVDKPASELLGEFLLGLGRPAEARAAFEASLARAPKRSLSAQGLRQAVAQSPRQ
jgi:tetratricopeptide (TPR) repeat protein